MNENYQQLIKDMVALFPELTPVYSYGEEGVEVIRLDLYDRARFHISEEFKALDSGLAAKAIELWFKLIGYSKVVFPDDSPYFASGLGPSFYRMWR